MSVRGDLLDAIRLAAQDVGYMLDDVQSDELGSDDQSRSAEEVEAAAKKLLAAVYEACRTRENGELE